jgi:hypothetical protein
MSMIYYQWSSADGKFIKKEKQPEVSKGGMKALQFKALKKSVKKVTTFVGVCFDSKALSWRAYIDIDGKRKALGNYPTDREAAIARDKVAIKYGRELNILRPANV